VTASKIAAAFAGVLTVLLVQASLIGPLTFPVPVSLPALMIIVVALYAGPGAGLGLGFGTGLLADLGSDHPAGVQALGWLAAGLLAGKLGGIVTQRRFGVRGVAALAAVLAALSSIWTGLLLAVLGSHGATALSVLHDVVPIGLLDALLGLAVVPLVRAVLRIQGVRSPRPGVTMIRNERIAVDVIGRSRDAA
jgi:rod shape-determining protein MreD